MPSASGNQALRFFRVHGKYKHLDSVIEAMPLRHKREPPMTDVGKEEDDMDAKMKKERLTTGTAQKVIGSQVIDPIQAVNPWDPPNSPTP